jgi:MFS family permease
VGFPALERSNRVTLYRNLPAGVYWLALAKFLMMGGNFVYQFFALFLTKRVGLTESTAGLFFTAATVVGLTGSVVGGWCADRFGRRRVFFIALLANGGLFLLVPLLSSQVIGALIAVVSIGIVSAAEPAINSLVSDCTQAEQRKAAFSLLYMGSNLGLALGPIAGGFLFQANTNYIFLADGLVTFIAASTIFGTKRTYVPRRGGASDNGEPATSTVAAIRNNPRVPLFCLLFVSHAFVYSQTTFSFPLLLDKGFGANGPILYGAFMTANGIAVIALTPLLTLLTRHTSSLRCVAIGIALYTAGFGLYGVVGNLWFVALSVCIWSAGEILATTNAKVFVAEQSAPTHRGRFNTLLDMSFETGFGLGPGVAGKVIVLFGIAAVWPLMAAVAAVGALGIFALGRHMERQTSAEGTRT